MATAACAPGRDPDPVEQPSPAHLDEAHGPDEDPAGADPDDDRASDTVATWGPVSLGAEDVVTAIGWRELASGTSVEERFGADWLDDDATLYRLLSPVFDEALLRRDCAEQGIALDEVGVDEAFAEDPVASRLRQRDDYPQVLARHHLDEADVRRMAAQTALYAAWIERRVDAVDDDELWNAWRSSRDRASLELVDVPNIHPRAAVDAFLAAEAESIEAWYADHPNHFLRRADEDGERTMRELDETVRREIAQRLLREREPAEAALQTARRVRDAMVAGDDAALEALLDEESLRLQQTGSFRSTRSGNVPGVGEAPPLSDLVFTPETGPGDVVGPVHVPSGVVVARIVEREHPTRERYEAERDAFRREYADHLRENAWATRVSAFGGEHDREVDLPALRAALRAAFSDR